MLNWAGLRGDYLFALDMSGTSHFWSRSRFRQEKNVGPGPVQKKKFGLGPAGTGTTLPISSYRSNFDTGKDETSSFAEEVKVLTAARNQTPS